MEENKVVEQVNKGGSGGKVIGIVGVIIAVIALVIALSNLGVKSEIEEVRQFAKGLEEKEYALELRAAQLDILARLDRIYVLTQVEKDYQSAAVELAGVKKLLEAVKPNLSQEKVGEIEKTIKALQAEIEKGPSPIPMLIAKLRTDLSTALVLGKPVAKEVKAQSKPEAPKAEVSKQTVEIKKPPVASNPANEPETGLKKTYLFWKRLGESLVKK